MDNLFMIRRAEEELDAEEMSVHALCDLIGMAPPKLWPPLGFGQEHRDWTRNLLKQDPDNIEWVPNFVAVRVDDTNHLVGVAGFSGKPGADRSVDLGVAIALEHQSRGYGTAAVKLAVKYAFMMSPELEAVTANVPASNAYAARVLEKNGFQLTGTRGAGNGASRHYRLDRATYEASRRG